MYNEKKCLAEILERERELIAAYRQATKAPKNREERPFLETCQKAAEAGHARLCALWQKNGYGPSEEIGKDGTRPGGKIG